MKSMSYDKDWNTTCNGSILIVVTTVESIESSKQHNQQH